MRMRKKSFQSIELSPYKFINHRDKLVQLASDEDVFPVTVELDLVAYCNHNCVWCVDPGHMETRLETSFALTLLDELKTIGVQGIVFKGGGEPSLHPDFSQIIEYADSKGFEIGIVTNGSSVQRYFKEIVCFADYIRISIDGPTSESHHSIHGSNDFESIIEGIRQLVEYKKSCEQRHPIIGLSFAMDYTMIKQVDQAAHLGLSLDVDYILLRPPFFEEAGRKNTMTAEQKRELLNSFEGVKSSNEGPMEVMIDYWLSDSDMKDGDFTIKNSPRRGGLKGRYNGIEHETRRCLAAPLLAVVSADQQVYPCCNLRFLDKWSLGQIDYDQDSSFQKVWAGSTRESIMKRINCVECLPHCTHPLSKYNEIIEYLRTPGFHKGFV